jgi:hypothetical protein
VNETCYIELHIYEKWEVEVLYLEGGPDRKINYLTNNVLEKTKSRLLDSMKTSIDEQLESIVEIYGVASIIFLLYHISKYDEISPMLECCYNIATVSYDCNPLLVSSTCHLFRSCAHKQI